MAKTTGYLDPSLLASLGNMELVARCAVEGLFTGIHPSPFHGFSVEYSDHRDYHPGDELKFLDWKMFGRSDRLYVKQFEQETNLCAYILLDSSMSMSFRGTGPVSKLDYGSFLSAALAYLMLNQGDSTALMLFAETIGARVPARSRRTHLSAVLRALEHNKPRGRTDLAAVLHELADSTHRRGLVVVISDLIDDVDDVFNGLAHLKFLQHDVIVFQTLDHQELDLDYEGLIQFEDLESSAAVRAFPQSLRESYRTAVGEFTEEVAHTCRRSEIDYCLLDTSRPLRQALIAYLARRRRMM